MISDWVNKTIAQTDLETQWGGRLGKRLDFLYFMDWELNYYLAIKGKDDPLRLEQSGNFWKNLSSKSKNENEP